MNTEAIEGLIGAGRVPVVASIAPDLHGVVHNVNADTAAAALAIALGAERLVVLTDVEGLYRDWPNSTEIVGELSASELEQLMPRLESGMAPKMEACLRAVRGGLTRATVTDGRVPHALLLEIFTNTGIGTMVTQDGLVRLGSRVFSADQPIPSARVRQRRLRRRPSLRSRTHHDRRYDPQPGALGAAGRAGLGGGARRLRARGDEHLRTAQAGLRPGRGLLPVGRGRPALSRPAVRVGRQRSGTRSSDGAVGDHRPDRDTRPRLQLLRHAGPGRPRGSAGRASPIRPGRPNRRCSSPTPGPRPTRRHSRSPG